MAEIHEKIRRHAVLNQWITQATSEREVLRREITEWLEDHKTDSITGQNKEGATLGSEKCKASYRKEDEPRVYEWLRERKADGVIKSVIHHGTFSALIGEMMENGVEIPDFIKTYVERRLTVRSGALEIPELPA